MTVEQFHAWVIGEMYLSPDDIDDEHEIQRAREVMDIINRATGGAFYMSVGRLADAYEFPQ